MSVTIKIDTDAFNRSFRKYVAVSKAALPDIVNKKAFWLARQAYTATNKADSTEISEFLTADKTSIQVPILRGKRKGKLRKVTFQKVSNRFKSIYLSKLWKKGVNPRSIEAGDLQRRMYLAAIARKRAIGFLKSGWLSAMRGMARSAHETATNDAGVRISGERKGRAIPARPGWSPVATIENSAGLGAMQNQSAQSRARVHTKLTKGLQEAFDRETASMNDYVVRKLNEAAHKALG